MDRAGDTESEEIKHEPDTPEEDSDDSFFNNVPQKSDVQELRDWKRELIACLKYQESLKNKKHKARKLKQIQ